MMTLSDAIRSAAGRLHSRDPERDGLRRAVRATIVIPLSTAASFGFGSQTTLLTIFGSFAVMVFADFPGNRQNRAVAYICLGLAGALLITLGTAVAPTAWLAVALMFCVGVALTFVGALSETLAAGQQAALLTFVLPACIPPGPVGERLLGWLIALALCVPASLFLLPPRHHAELRRHAAQACATLADRLEGVGSAEDVTAAMDALRANFLGSNFRPVGLTAGSRALVRVVDDLEWIADQVNQHTGAALGPMRESAIHVLRCCALMLAAPRADRDARRGDLDVALAELHSVARGDYSDDIVLLLGERDDHAAVRLGRELLVRRGIGATICVTGRVMAAAAAADARPVWARALGLRLPKTITSDRWVTDTAADSPLTSGFLSTHSVTLHNSLRTGLGLALAVTITHVFPVEHAFWVVLGVISVLRSSALTTGTKVLRAVLGTAIGVVLGGLLITVVGVDPIVMWVLLPLAVFGSAYVPEVASFTAGQAAFTMALLIIFNLIQPTGWRVGLLRVEDIVIGALAGMVVSLLLWPRGAAASVNAALEAARDAGARQLRAAVLRVTRGASKEIDDHVTALSHSALVATATLDDTVRQYLSEKGGATDHRAPVVRAFNRAIRLHAAADLIAHVPPPPPLPAYPRTRRVLEAHADVICARVAGQVDSTQIPPPISDELVPALRAESAGDDEAIAAAVPLITVAVNIGELELIYPAQAEAVVPVVS